MKHKIFGGSLVATALVLFVVAPAILKVIAGLFGAFVLVGAVGLILEVSGIGDAAQKTIGFLADLALHLFVGAAILGGMFINAILGVIKASPKKCPDGVLDIPGWGLIACEESESWRWLSAQNEITMFAVLSGLGLIVILLNRLISTESNKLMEKRG